MQPATPSAGVLHGENAPDVRARPTTDNVRITAWGAGTAAAAVSAAHVVGAELVDPVLDPVSFYAFVPGGAALVLAGCLALGLLGVVLVARAYDAGLLRGPVPLVAIIVFAVSMVLIGLFPTDPPGEPTSASALVHRISAATAFCVLPLVALGSARDNGAATSRLDALRTFGAALLSSVVVFLAIHLPLVAVGSGILAFGLLERLGLVLMGAFLALLAVELDRHLNGERAAAPAV